MKEFLRKLKLVDHLTVELEIEKSDFVERFKQVVDFGSVGEFGSLFDLFSRSKNEYIGSVHEGGFMIKRKRKLFNPALSMAVATGQFIQKGQKLTINSEINSFKGRMVFFYAFAFIFYCIFVAAFFIPSEGQSSSMNSYFLPFIFMHAAFMFGIPYFFMRSATKAMKRELEREFFYLTKN